MFKSEAKTTVNVYAVEDVFDLYIDQFFVNRKLTKME